MLIGNQIERALKVVGITKDRVEAFLGEPCGCTERQEKLNALGIWAARILRGKVDRAVEFFERLTADSP